MVTKLNSSRTDTLRRFWPLLLIVGGVLIVFGGFIYDGMFAGIPYQDPTPEMSASYAHHAGIASVMRWYGVAVFLFGAVAGVVRRVTRKPSVASLLAVTLLAWVVLSGPATASITPDSKPKDWPANPAKHRVVITREAADAKQTAMIAAAEAAQPSKETLRQAAEARDRNDPLGLAQPKEAKAPVGDKVWWYKEQLGIRIPCAITADAVTYYSDLVGKYGKQVLKRYTEPSSRLDYHAGVKFHKDLKLGDKTFNDVHVVTLKLTFDQNFVATTTEGMHFQKERIVVLDAKGKVLHISGDGPTEVPILAI